MCVCVYVYMIRPTMNAFVLNLFRTDGLLKTYLTIRIDFVINEIYMLLKENVYPYIQGFVNSS